MSKFKNWKDVKKELDFTPEEIEEMELEKEIIKATIEARKKANLTQKEFAKRINKSEDWQYSNESGRSRYFFNDIIEIANKYDLEIIIKDKEKK